MRSEEQHLGRGALHAGRPGHIPTGANVPYSALVDRDTQAFLPRDKLAAVFAERGVDVQNPVIAYCGAAIAACSAALALELVDADDAAVYDGSLREWSRDPARPLITG